MKKYILNIIVILSVLSLFLYPMSVLAANTHSATLNGTSQYFTAADSASLSITGNLTAEMWVKLVVNNTAQMLIGKGDGYGANDGYYILYNGTAPTLGMRFAKTADPFYYNANLAITALATATWIHLAIVYTASTGVVEFFKDGVSLGTATGAPTAIEDSATVQYIGADQPNARYYLDGKVDEVRLWNTARTATQINNNKAISIDSATNLQASWHLNDALTDSSGNSNGLTNVNSATFTTDIPYTDAEPAVLPKRPNVIFFE